MSEQQTILITGCSSGIGAALAQEFARRGHSVIATARKPETVPPGPNIRALALDVTDAQSIARLVEILEGEGKPIDMLINNAGFGTFGAMVDLSVADMRAQFDTNVFAPVAVSSALLPLLRKSQRACIANVGSISGLVTTPFSGIYGASKAALHSISDAMRMELLPLGVRVVTIQPGGIASNFGNAGEQHIHLPANSLFQPIAKYIQRRAQLSQHKATPAADFANVVVTHLLDPNAGPVCRTGAQSIRLPWLKRVLPTRTTDAKMRKAFGLDKLR
ncbi:MAG TPA: SDR family NAD(P)-dependent oxidoreductase [Burkholderiaceae bacterium]